MSKSKRQFARKRSAASAKAKPVSDATPHLVEITKPLYGGQFLARYEGNAVFVPLALPGERVSVRMTEEKKGYSVAEPLETVLISTDRTTPRCPHFGACGGCNYQHASYEAQLAMKESILRETLTRSGVSPTEKIDVIAADPWAYRNRIRLGFGAQGNPGYRGRRSHAIVPISECPIAAPALISAAEEIAELCRNASPAIRLSEVSLFCNHNESQIQATLFTANSDKRACEPLLGTIAARIPALKGIEVVAAPAEHQPAQNLAQWGEASIAYQAGGFDYRVDQGAFFQVNRWLIDALIQRVVAGRSGAVAWDLFAGVGLFARQLARSFEQVVAVESAPNSIAALKANLTGTAATPVRATTLDFLQRTAQLGKRTAEINKPDLVVVDPPRTGLGPEVTALLGQIAPKMIVYVSCDPATLARDLKELIDAGYSIDSIALADLFPQTYHLESIVQLHHS